MFWEEDGIKGLRNLWTFLKLFQSPCKRRPSSPQPLMKGRKHWQVHEHHRHISRSCAQKDKLSGAHNQKYSFLFNLSFWAICYEQFVKSAIFFNQFTCHLGKLFCSSLELPLRLRRPRWGCGGDCSEWMLIAPAKECTLALDPKFHSSQGVCSDF